MLIIKDKSKGGADVKKIVQLRYTPYEISSNNFNSFFIDNNELHNFIVCLFALTDSILSSFYNYIRTIKDPLQRLVELTLRYGIFRNFVLSIEVKIS